MFLANYAWALSELVVSGLSNHPQARATVVLTDSYNPSNKVISLRMEGLKPLHYYSVYLFNSDDLRDSRGIGEFPYTFRAAENGCYDYSCELADYDFTTWKYLKVSFHPNQTEENPDRVTIIKPDGSSYQAIDVFILSIEKLVQTTVPGPDQPNLTIKPGSK